jgi:hypothetical protein
VQPKEPNDGINKTSVKNTCSCSTVTGQASTTKLLNCRHAEHLLWMIEDEASLIRLIQE